MWYILVLLVVSDQGVEIAGGEGNGWFVDSGRGQSVVLGKNQTNIVTSIVCVCLTLTVTSVFVCI